MIHRIIFDRSICHKERFWSLKRSPLSKLASTGKIRLLFTPVFIEETLQYAFKNPSDFLTQWNYLVSINNSRWFNLTNEILAIELGDRIIGRKYYLRPSEDIQKIIMNVPNLINGSISDDEFYKARDEMKQNRFDNQELRKERLKIRNSRKQEKFNIEDIFNNNVEWYIEKGLMKWHSNSTGYLSVWRNNKNKCRFTNSFIRASLSILLLPVIDHNLKIDKNDKQDAEQLAFLEWGDIFVSDDKRFMRQSFDLLFRNSQKRFMSSLEFITFLNKL